MRTFSEHLPESPMTATLLTRHAARPRPMLAIAPEIALARGRVHEVCGPARHVLALAAAARLDGPVIWLRFSHVPEALCPDGVAAWFNPGRILQIGLRRPEDMLWSMEEALRAGCAPLVVAELPEPPPLTPVRRLHLAAEAGAGQAAGPPPLGLLLTPGEGGAQGVESRWHMAPRPGWALDGPPRWRLTRARARMAMPKTWEATCGKAGLAPVSSPAR